MDNHQDNEGHQQFGPKHQNLYYVHSMR